MYRSPPQSGDFQWDPEKRHRFMQVSRFLQLLNQLRDCRNLGEELIVKKPVGAKSPRQVLLDAVAFVSCSERKSGKVSAVTMETLGDGEGIRFRIAMNEGVPDPVLDGLRLLGELLTELSNGNGTEYDIFDSIVTLKQNNLKGFLTTFLLKSFDKTQEKILFRGQRKRFPEYSRNLSVSPDDEKANGPYNEETHGKHMADAWERFKTLHQLCRDAVTEEKDDVESTINLDTVKQLILLTWEIRHMRCFRYFLSCEKDPVAKALIKSLRKLCKYFQSTVNLVKAARSPEFAPLIGKKILFATIPMLPASSPPIGAQDSLTTFLMSLGYRIDDLHRYCSKTKQSLGHIAKRFEGLSNMTNTVHAEVRLVFFYSQRQELAPAPEIGSSKHACYLCHLFIKHHPFFTVPDTHKVIYCGWSFPAFPGETPAEIKETARKMMVEMERGVNEDFMVDPRKPMCSASMPPLSTSGVSDTVESESRKRVTNGEDDALEEIMTEDEIAGSEEYTLSGSDTLNEFIPGEGIIEFPDDIPILTNCAVCKTVTMRRCTSCKNRAYCSESCQRADEPTHVFTCSTSRPITSADRLVLSCLENSLPADASTVSGFGFDRCATALEWGYLLRLYFGLIKYLSVTSRDLHKWSTENSLAENIDRLYRNSEFDENACYKWFLANRSVLEPSTPKKSPFDHTNLEKLLPEKDAGLELSALRPAAKRDAAILYMELNAGWHPHPREHLWMDFGFCTCKGETGPAGEMELAKFYRALTAKCSFNQFWKAHESRTLERLARKKGFGDKVKDFNASGVRIGFPRAAPGVYALKRYILNNANIVPGLSVVVEYGLCNCLNLEEKRLWHETYRQLIAAGEFEDMELQKACDRGGIWEYTKAVLGDVDGVFERLCANPKKYGK
ncbi:hypothetical protein RUND412_008663 [Rhizina undulata]